MILLCVWKHFDSFDDLIDRFIMEIVSNGGYLFCCLVRYIYLLWSIWSNLLAMESIHTVVEVIRKHLYQSASLLHLFLYLLKVHDQWISNCISLSLKSKWILQNHLTFICNNTLQLQSYIASTQEECRRIFVESWRWSILCVQMEITMCPLNDKYRNIISSKHLTKYHSFLPFYTYRELTDLGDGSERQVT